MLKSLKKRAAEKGYKTYFTGKPCVNGHIERRETVTGVCLKCAREKRRYEKTKEYRAQHNEKFREYHREYYQQNNDILKERQKEYFKKPASFKTFHKQLIAIDDPREDENGLLLVACYMCKKHFNPSRRQVANRIQAINGNYTIGDEHNLYCSDECKGSCAVYRKTSRPSEGFDEQLLDIWAADVKNKAGYRCEICGKTEDLHSHHIEPKSIAPKLAYDIENGMCLCRECHYGKGHSGDCSTGNLAVIRC